MGLSQDIKVSVIVAVYNAEPFLRQCLTSIADQSLREIEIICVNDGSTDASPEILRAFAADDGRIVVCEKENEGLGGASARNLGLERARGEYVSILDSDDFFELDMLEKAVAEADLTNADIVVFGGYEYDHRNGNIFAAPSILNTDKIPQKEVFSYRDCPEDIYQLSQGMAWNKLYRRAFLKKHNLRFQNIKYTDDVYFTFAHMVLAERIAVLRECLCCYRVNTGSNQTAGLANYPDSAYLPYTALKESLVAWGIYGAVQRSFVNCAAAFFRYFYDKIDRYDRFKYLHDKFRDEMFAALDIGDKNADYFYDALTYLWVRQVAENSAGELAFKAARAYGNEYTTAALRLHFPYDAVKSKSRIVIIGAGIMGRHFYAQLMLSAHCEVVMWAEWENKLELSYIKSYDELRNATFDYAVIAYINENLISKAMALLNEMGVPKEKIVLGGNVK
jgi:glycosyltransferase involved in cell wall biosynthesis